MTPEERIEKLEKRVDELASKLDMIINRKSDVASSTDSSDIAKRRSARGFILGFDAKTETDKTLVAIKLLENKGMQSITTKEIADAFKEMREPLPQNISDKVQMLDKRGYIVISGKDGKRKCWLVSNDGENYLRGLRKDDK